MTGPKTRNTLGRHSFKAHLCTFSSTIVTTRCHVTTISDSILTFVCSICFRISGKHLDFSFLHWPPCYWPFFLCPCWFELSSCLVTYFYLHETVSGIQGIVEAYRMVLPQLRLSGPTNFSPIINHVASIAASGAQSNNASVRTCTHKIH